MNIKEAIDQLIEKLMDHFSSDAYESQIKEARMEFSERAGIIDEASDDFDSQLAQFVDWYMFSRSLKDGKAPIDLVADIEGIDFSDEEKQLYESLRSNKHSLFEFLKLSSGDLYVKDLFSNYKMTLKDSPVTHGFNKGDIFEGRLFPWDDNFVFSSGFCFHPQEANKFIKKQIKQINKQPEEGQFSQRQELMLKLHRMKGRYEHYRHVDIGMIYSDDPKLKF